MNMDRSQKNLEKKKDDRTIEYLDCLLYTSPSPRDTR